MAHYNLAVALSRVGRKEEADREFAIHRKMQEANPPPVAPEATPPNGQSQTKKHLSEFVSKQFLPVPGVYICHRDAILLRRLLLSGATTRLRNAFGAVTPTYPYVEVPTSKSRA